MENDIYYLNYQRVSHPSFFFFFSLFLFPFRKILISNFIASLIKSTRFSSTFLKSNSTERTINDPNRWIYRLILERSKSVPSYQSKNGTRFRAMERRFRNVGRKLGAAALYRPSTAASREQFILSGLTLIRLGNMIRSERGSFLVSSVFEFSSRAFSQWVSRPPLTLHTWSSKR